MMRALSARTGSKRGRHLRLPRFAYFEDSRDATELVTEVSACFKLQK